MKLRTFATTAVFGLLTLGAQAGVLIPSTSLNAIARGQFSADRAPNRVLNGLLDGSITAGVDPNDPAGYSNNSTIGNTAFGQGPNWSHNNAANQWLRVDLGQDYTLEEMAFFNIAFNGGTNNNRCIQQADVYYRTEAQGDGNNTSGDGVAFDNTGWTLLGTAGAQNFTQTTPSDTAIAPDVVSFGSVTVRYVAFDVNSSYGSANIGIGELLFFEDIGADPALAVDGGSPDQNFAFGNAFEPTSPTRTVQYVNNSPGGNTITINSVTVTDDGGGVFGTPTVTYSGTNVLADGDTASIEVPVTTGGSGAASGTLEIDTTSSGGGVDPDFNDKVVGLAANLIASGEKLNPNPFLESSLADWDLPGAKDAVPVSPGLAGGSQGMARVPGNGDPGYSSVGNYLHPASFMQSDDVANGAPNWQLTAYFSPINISNFASYADPDGALAITGADGVFGDRTFQLVVLSADTGRPFPDFDNAQASGTLINIAYMPDGVPDGSGGKTGSPDFYVFDGDIAGTVASPAVWIPTGIGAILGSVDNDSDADATNGFGDGLLDTSVDVLDDINAYRLVVTGTGFGAPGASYDITVSKVSGSDTFTTATASGLTAFQGVSGDTGTPAGYSFITSDISADPDDGSNQGDGLDLGISTPYWVDDVCFFNVAGPDPSLIVANLPDSISVSAPATSGTSTFTIRNDGGSTNLDIDSASFAGGTGFTVDSPSVPFSVAPGSSQLVTIEWDSATASDTFETSTLTIEDTGNGLSSDVPIKAGLSFGGFVVLDYNDHVLGNMAQAANDGTGIGFTEASWNGGTGTQQIIAGDLDLTTVPGYSVPAGGTPQSHSTNNNAGRQQERQIDIGDGINPVWFSFLAQKPNSAGRVGVGFNVNGTGGSDPRVLWLNNTLAFRTGNANVAAVTLTSTASTQLIVGRITINDLPTGEDRVEVWVNPADMSSIAALGAPDINYAGANSLGDGLTRLNPSVYAGVGGNEPTLDNVRLSDLSESAAFDVIRTGITPVIDPVLEVDGGSADPDFNHGNIFATGSSSRAVTFVNTSDSGSETITINSVTLTDDAGGVFGTPIVIYSGTNVLGNGDTMTITVPASAATGEYTGEITIDTLSSGLFDPSNNDRVLPLSANFYADGEKLNGNGFFDAGLGGWGGGSATAPGIAPGSLNGARVVGAGDPSGGFSASAFQATGIPDGAPDWEFTAYFTPAAASTFGDYAGTTITAADGDFTDRTFQWVLLGADEPRPDDGAPDIGFDDTVMANAIVNIAYLPDGNTSGGTPDFYVFDGTAGANGTWVATGIGAIAGSIDADDDGDPSNGIGDGDFDDTTDTLNVYRLRVVGSGFGTVAASYDVSVSKVVGPDTFPGGSASGRTEFHGLDGTSNAPAAHGFATNDVSTTSNFGDGTDQGITTPFWVDDACFFAGSAPDPNLVLLGVPDTISVFAPDIASTTAVFIRNDGESLGLDVSSITLTGTGFSAVTSPALPTTLAAGALQQVDLTFDSAAIAPDTAAITELTVDSNDPLEPSVTRTISGAATSFSKLIANEGFEVGGFDDTTDTDTFAVWDELGVATLTTDVPGLDDTTMTAAYVGNRAEGIAGLSQFFGSPVTNFDVQIDFAIQSGTSTTRLFSFEIESFQSGGRANLRYQDGQVWMYNDTASQGSTGWQSIFPAALTPSVDVNGNGDLTDPGDSLTYYTLQISATGWGYPDASYDVTILDSGGGTAGSATGVAFFQGGLPTGPADQIITRNEFGNNPGFWVDNACASGELILVDLGPITITAFSIDPSTGAGAVTFDSLDGAPYSLRGSDDVNDADLFDDAGNIITSGAGTGASTTLPFTDADAIGKDHKSYRIQSP